MSVRDISAAFNSRIRYQHSVEVIDNSPGIQTQKDEIDPFQLTLVMEPGAIGPNQTKGQGDEHCPWKPVTDDGNGAENAESQRNPFQLLFKTRKTHQHFDMAPLFMFSYACIQLLQVNMSGFCPCIERTPRHCGISI